MTFFRRRYGLRWEKARPPILTPHLFAVLVIFLLFALAGSLDYAIAKAEMLERVAGVYEAQARVLRDCERGATGYYYIDSGRTYQCGKPL